MELGEKLRFMRSQEGLRRGLWRAMTQREVVTALRQELGVSFSQAYLSQLEQGRRMHLSSATREALARFYHVHPGYLVSDPPGYDNPIPSSPAGAGPHIGPDGHMRWSPQLLPAGGLAQREPPQPFRHVWPTLATGDAQSDDQTPPPNMPQQPPSGADDETQALAGRLIGMLRDHPDSQRVLLLLDSLLRLSDEQLASLDGALGLSATPLTANERDEM